MTSLSDYESGLDRLDTQLFATATGIQCDFGGGYFFPYASLRTFEIALSIARDLSLIFLEENVNASYLAKRFLRLASNKTAQLSRIKFFPDFFYSSLFGGKVVEKVIDVDAAFRKHDFHYLTIEGNKSITITRSPSELHICFVGPQPHFFFRLSKGIDATKVDRSVPVRIERPAFSDWHFVQFLDTNDLEIVLLTEYIIFDLPTTHSWRDTSDGKLQNWAQHDAMRIALRHHLTDSEVQSTVSELRKVCTGLNLSVSSFNAISEKYKFAKLSQ